MLKLVQRKEGEGEGIVAMFVWVFEGTRGLPSPAPPNEMARPLPTLEQDVTTMSPVTALRILRFSLTRL